MKSAISSFGKVCIKAKYFVEEPIHQTMYTWHKKSFIGLHESYDSSQDF